MVTGEIYLYIPFRNLGGVNTNLIEAVETELVTDGADDTVPFHGYVVESKEVKWVVVFLFITVCDEEGVDEADGEGGDIVNSARVVVVVVGMVDLFVEPCHSDGITANGVARGSVLEDGGEYYALGGFRGVTWGNKGVDTGAGVFHKLFFWGGGEGDCL